MSVNTKQDEYNRIRNGFQEMTRQDIVIAPWLAMDDKQKRLSDTLRLQLQKHARDLSASARNSEVFWIDIDLTAEFRERAFYEVLLSTAAYLSYMRLGTLIITEEMVSVSNSLLGNYIEHSGSTTLLSVYARVLTYFNTQFVSYYGQVSEDVFISGAWHRPWIEYSIEHELESAIRHGFMEKIDRDGKRLISLTEAGQALYSECRDDLEKCGYIKQREQLMRAASFTSMDDYEDMMERFTSEFHDVRRSLITWSDIQSGMNVLELGCGAGSLTLDDGLYEAVGSHGSVVATDPSLGMLRRARVKQDKLNVTNVQFQHAAAEALPFPDNTFDATIGMLFLHFTDVPKALHEIQRVTRPGGTFTTFYALNFDEKEPFFEEWFEPIFKSGITSEKSVVLPDKALVPNVAEEYFGSIEYRTGGLYGDWSGVEDIVKFLVQAGTMAELNELPWGARDTLFTNLIARGHDVKRKYGSAGMKRFQAAQWFKGTVKK